MSDASLGCEADQPVRYESIVSWVNTSLLLPACAPLCPAIDGGPLLG